MAGELLNPLLGFGAGVLTILSPCVLPLVPVVLGSAAQRHRLGPLALALGLIASFTTVGFALAVFGSRLGIDAEQVRSGGGVILAAAGIYLLAPVLQDRFALAAGPLIAWAGRCQQDFDNGGLIGQASIGVLLGVIWSPCVGPTLGAAIALAAQGQRLSAVALTMGAFATGIGSILLAIAFLGRKLFDRIRGDAAAKAKTGKLALGGILLIVGGLIMTGFDRLIEANFVETAPDWLIAVTTRL